MPALPPGKRNPSCLAVQGVGSPSAAIVSVQLLGKDSCSADLIRLLVRTLCAPSSVGFNVGDVRVMEQLPGVCVGLLRALRMSPHRNVLEARLREEVTAERWGSGRAQCGGGVSQGLPGPRTVSVAGALQASKRIPAGLMIVRVLTVRRLALTWFFFVFLAWPALRSCVLLTCMARKLTRRGPDWLLSCQLVSSCTRLAFCMSSCRLR